MNYTLVHDTRTGIVVGVLRSDNAYVPRVASNADWQDFLRWNAAQLTPLSLADDPSKIEPQRRPKPLGPLVAEIVAWIGNDPVRLRRVAALALADALRRDPSLARRIGDAIDGDEPVV